MKPDKVEHAFDAVDGKGNKYRISNRIPYSESLRDYEALGILYTEDGRRILGRNDQEWAIQGVPPIPLKRLPDNANG